MVGIMPLRNKEWLLRFITISLTFFFLGFFSFFNVISSSADLNDQCVQCHVDVVTFNMSRPNLHMPFFEKKCTTCHLPDNSQAVNSQGEQAGASVSSGDITGVLVTQQSLWRKRTVFSASSDKMNVEHQAVIMGLDPSIRYRFRLVAKDVDSGNVLRASKWIGLAPSEAIWQQTPVINVSAAEDDLFSAVTLNRFDNIFYLGWQTLQPTSGEVEVEELDGDVTNPATTADGSTGLEAAPSATSDHVALRDPEELTIEICYTCHPPKSLGTSHPVRVYASAETPIPPELPTIDGMVTCVTCHEPHAADSKEHLIRLTIETKLCVACHIKFKGSSKYTVF